MLPIFILGIGGARCRIFFFAQARRCWLRRGERWAAEKAPQSQLDSRHVGPPWSRLNASIFDWKRFFGPLAALNTFLQVAHQGKAPLRRGRRGALFSRNMAANPAKP